MANKELLQEVVTTLKALVSALDALAESAQATREEDPDLYHLIDLARVLTAEAEIRATEYSERV